MTETTTAQTMAVLAELVLMATRHNLPMPMYLTASEKNCQLNLTLNNRADLDAWHWAFGGGRLWECEPTASSQSVLVTNMHSGSLLGWSVNLQANVPPPLSPEVLAALGEAARADAAVLVAEAVAVLDDCTCDLNLRQVCDTCQAVSAPVKAVPAAAALDEPKAAAPNVLLDATLAALPEPKPGQQYTDYEGDLWQVQSDGTLLWLDTRNIKDRQAGLTKPNLLHLAKDFGPLTAGPLVEVPAPVKAVDRG